MVLRMQSCKVIAFVRSLPEHDGTPFEQKFASLDTVGISLVKEMVVFSPGGRITALRGLSHPFVAPYHDPSDEPSASNRLTSEFEGMDLAPDDWKEIIMAEIKDFHQRFGHPEG